MTIINLEPWQDPYHPDFDVGDPRWRALDFEQRQTCMRTSEHNATAKGEIMWKTVFATQGDGYNFVYTIGRTPPIIATGTLHHEFVAEAPPPETTGIGVIFEMGGGFTTLKAVYVPTGTAAEPLTHQKGAVQFTWQDEDGRWPWDPGHARWRDIARFGVDTAPMI